MRKKTNLKKIEKSSKGITLIALVITIIVLLILVAVTIVALTGDNGILTKARDAAKIHTEEQNKEMNILADYEKYLNTLTDNECQIPQIFGNLDITYKVEGTKLYLYPTISGYNHPTPYMTSLLSKVKTDEQKEDIVMKIMAMGASQDSSLSGLSKEETLEKINEIMGDTAGKNFDSLAEFYDYLIKNTNSNSEVIISIISYFVPNNEIDSTLLLASSMMDTSISRHQHGVPITDSDKEEILNQVNKSLNFLGTTFDSYEELKNEGILASNLSSTGIMAGLFSFWIDNGENFSQFYTTLNVNNTSEIVIEIDLSTTDIESNKFIISNAFESKIIEIDYE